MLEAMNRRYTADDYRRVVDAPAPRAARSGAVVRFHRRLPGRDRRRFRGDAAPGRRDRLRPGLLVQVQRPARHAGGRPAAPGAGGGQGRAAARAAGAARTTSGGLQRRLRRPHPAGAARAGGPPPGPTRRPHPLSAGRACRGAADCASATRCRSRSPSVMPHSLGGHAGPPAPHREGGLAPEHARTAPRPPRLQPPDALRRQRRLRRAVRPAPSQSRPDRAEAAGQHRHPRQRGLHPGRESRATCASPRPCSRTSTAS